MNIDGYDGNDETQNVEFLDTDVGYVSNLPTSLPPKQHIYQTPNVDLGDFLNRPVRVSTVSWAISDAVGNKTTFSPWQLFINNTAISNKIANYAFIRGKLKLKAVINASPFYYGAMLVSYLPLPNFRSSTSVVSGANDQFIQLSQRPHQWIYPSENKGFEMELPFFYFKNWLTLQTNQEFADMGTISCDITSALQSANGVAANTVTIQFYAWMVDAELSGPSVGLSLQAGSTKVQAMSTNSNGSNNNNSKIKINMDKAKSYSNSFQRYTAVTRDEYDGIISKPASAIAAAVGCLSNLPVIGYYARATEIGMNAVAGVASLFGFTNVPNIKDIDAVQVRTTPAMASSEISFPVEKLTLDPKNELSISQSIVGDVETDNLIVSNIVQKESLLATSTWAVSDTTNQIIMACTVNPVMYTIATVSSIDNIYFTPMGYISKLFNNWRGDIIFRIKLIATKFHKGRLRLTYDPRGQSGTNLYNTQDNTSMIFNKVIDLDESTNVEFRIPYQQALSWLNINSATTANQNYTSRSGTFNYDQDSDNGSWCLQVLTNLSAPITSSTVEVQLFVRGAENLEFANPVNIDTHDNRFYSLMAPQAGTSLLNDDGDFESIIVGNDKSHEDPNRYVINYGEAIYSIRSLLRRYSRSYVMNVPLSLTNTSILTYFFSRLPKPFGYDSGGLESAKGVITTLSNFNFNFSTLHPITWMQGLFIGYRGGTHVSANPINTIPEEIRIYRIPSTVSASSKTTTSSAAVTTISVIPRFYMSLTSGGASGSAMTNGQTQPTLNIHAPNMSRYKFQSTQLSRISTPSATDDSNRDFLMLETSFSNADPSNITEVALYFAIGTDFNFIFFINTPMVYAYNALPTL